ncbi:hypothetical protein [Maribellus sp. YY47]|uniref:hypothetical protein n=1 Tax=Maribellus sp. YY47 TaxID=2929486 RepID=UPI002000AE91|nr:hypothetical protein [Maribellus sp. YY47]MCK3684217.1 hypothetical protein [Maribellus sp. YY47]
MNNFRIIQVLFLVVVAGLFQSCDSNKKNWEIKGTAESESMVFLYRLYPEASLIDSTQTNHRKFTFAGENGDERLEPFCLVFGEDQKTELICMLRNGDHLKLQPDKQAGPSFSGTEISDDLNKYYTFKKLEKQLNADLLKELNETPADDDGRDQKMISYREKVQNLENEKTEFLRSIVFPGLNGYLVLKELQHSGVVEKEVVGKYRDALTAEGALTDYGIKVHRIYEFFDAYALSREMEILDSATISERYNKLSEENKTSAFAKIVEQYLLKLKTE